MRDVTLKGRAPHSWARYNVTFVQTGLTLFVLDNLD